GIRDKLVTGVQTCALPICGTDGVEQKSPRLMPLTAKRAALEATARSHWATSWQPAAVAMPCTRAITGTGRRTRPSIIRVHCANRSEERRVGKECRARRETE